MAGSVGLEGVARAAAGLAAAAKGEARGAAAGMEGAAQVEAGSLAAGKAAAMAAAAGAILPKYPSAAHGRSKLDRQFQGSPIWRARRKHL